MASIVSISEEDPLVVWVRLYCLTLASRLS